MEARRRGTNDLLLTRREALRTGAAVLGGGLAGCSDAAQGQRAAHPNVLWIIADQHRADVAGFAGDANAHTPELDRLAAQSVGVSDVYCQVPLCVPARQSLLTGSFAHTHGMLINAEEFPAGQRTFADDLVRAGYATALIGKTHCNTSGFQHVRTFREQLDEFRAAHPGGRRPGQEHFSFRKNLDRFDYVSPMNPSHRPPGDGPLFFMEEAVVRDVASYLEGRAAERPFFVWASLLSPHPPLFAPREYHALYAEADLPLRGSMAADEPGLFEVHATRRRRQGLDQITPEQLLGITRAYYASVAWADHCIGQLLGVLAEQGLAEDTLVIYTSDHGEMLGEHGLLQKRALFEGAARIPCLVRWPGRLPAGALRENVAQHLDLVTTLFDLIGVPVPDGFAGRSMRSLLLGEDAAWRDLALCEFPGAGERGSLPWALRAGRFKYIRHSDRERALYDLEADPGEGHNLLRGASDAEHAEKVSEMHERYEEIADATEWIARRRR